VGRPLVYGTSQVNGSRGVMTLIIRTAPVLGAFFTMERTTQSERLSKEELVDDAISC